ncbi:hypothetical protein ACHAWT_002618, partial [Skeletonema menzelii]
ATLLNFRLSLYIWPIPVARCILHNTSTQTEIVARNIILLFLLSWFPRWRRRWWKIPSINQVQRTLLSKQNHLITRSNMYQLQSITGTTLDC